MSCNNEPTAIPKNSVFSEPLKQKCESLKTLREIFVEQFLTAALAQKQFKLYTIKLNFT